MNRTVTINVSGIVFHINEDAFTALSDYLAAIRAYVSGTAGSAEILSDIEARIAELLQNTISDAKQVITLEDIQSVRSVMGNPEDFAADEAEPAPGAAVRSERRKLFRDPDDKVIGGVCSGLAAYFDIDTVWVRLAMVLLVFFGGLSIWVYLIMWMVMPIARTTAEKAAMRGERADIQSIMRSVKDEAYDVGSRLSGGRNRVASNASSALNAFFSFGVRFLGAIILAIGCLLMIGFLTSLFGITLMAENTMLSQWRSALLDSPSAYLLGVISYILVAGIPIAMLIYGGVKLLFRLRYSNRWLNTALGIIWLAGLVCGLYITGSTMKNFSESARLRKTERIAMSDTIAIRMTPATRVIQDLEGKQDDPEEIEENGGYLFRHTAGGTRIVGFARLYVTETDGDSVTVTVYRCSRGAANPDANMNARDISYHYTTNGNTLQFDQVFLTGQPRFRAQEVEVRVGVPRGKVIAFDENTRHSIEDADNTSNVWPGRLAGRRWRMTENGLACIDCAGLDADEEHHHRHRRHDKSNITINDLGIHVEDSDGEVRIDEHGIRIHEK